MARKAFTVQEANRLLPTLERALERIERAASIAREHHEKLQVLDALWGEDVHRGANPDHDEWQAHRAALAAAVNSLEHEIATEITGRGIRFPAGGLQHGLLDFPTTWDGRWVFLCWRRGEASVLAWHELGDGFAGRQPVTAEHERRMGRETPPESLEEGLLDF